MSTTYTQALNRYTGNGVTTQFSVGFPYTATSEVKVYLKVGNNTQVTLTEGTDYSFVNSTTILFPKSGSTYSVLTSSDTLAIQRESSFSSSYVFDNQQRLYPEEVMNCDDMEMRHLQELKRDSDRSIKLTPTSGVDVDDLLDEVERVYDSIDNIDTVADDISNVNTTAGSITNVNNVGNDIANVNAVANDLTNIDTVKADLTNVDTVAGSIANVNLVGADITNVNSVAGDLTNIDAVNANKTNIDTTAGSIANVNTCASNISAITSAPTYASNANIWAEGTDAQVATLGGVHSSKGWAAQSAQSQVNSDFNETDSTQKSFIMNKRVVSTMPTAISTLVGKVYQYEGTTDSNYTKGLFYQCVQLTGNTPASTTVSTSGTSGLGTVTCTTATFGDEVNEETGSYQFNYNAYPEVITVTNSSNVSKTLTRDPSEDENNRCAWLTSDAVSLWTEKELPEIGDELFTNSTDNNISFLIDDSVTIDSYSTTRGRWQRYYADDSSYEDITLSDYGISYNGVALIGAIITVAYTAEANDANSTYGWQKIDDIIDKTSAQTISGAKTFSGTTTLSGAITSSGNNTFSGNNIITGAITSSGNNTFSGTNAFSGTTTVPTSTNLLTDSTESVNVKFVTDNVLPLTNGTYAYAPQNLATKFASEIGSTNIWTWLHNRVVAGNFKGINIGDYILDTPTLTTVSGFVSATTFGGTQRRFTIMDINGYKNSGSSPSSSGGLAGSPNPSDGRTGNHLIIYAGDTPAIQWNPSNFTCGSASGSDDTGKNNPWLCSKVFAVLNGVDNANGSTSGFSPSGSVLQSITGIIPSSYIGNRTFYAGRKPSGQTSFTGEGPWLTYGRLFLPSEIEVYGCQIHSLQGAMTGTNFDAFGPYNQWQFFRLYGTRGWNAVFGSSDRWLSSVASGSSVYACYVGWHGSAYRGGASHTVLVAPVCFVFI